VRSLARALFNYLNFKEREREREVFTTGVCVCVSLKAGPMELLLNDVCESTHEAEYNHRSVEAPEQVRGGNFNSSVSEVRTLESAGPLPSSSNSSCQRKTYFLTISRKGENTAFHGGTEDVARVESIRSGTCDESLRKV
jgi:hypothetical protein